MSNNFNKELCAKCGGRCCKKSGCLISVRDCKEGIREKLGELLRKNAVTLYVFPTDVFIELIIESIVQITDGNLIASRRALELLSPQFRCLKGYPEVYIVKMRSEGWNKIEHINSLDDDLWRFDQAGKCVKLTSTGCEYSDDERPYGGVALIPRVTADGNHYICHQTYSLMDNATEWLFFHGVLWELFI